MSKQIITDYMAGQIGNKYYESLGGKLEYIAEIGAIDDNDNNQRYKLESNDHGLSWSAKKYFDHFEREVPDEKSESDEGMERITDITQVRPGDTEVARSGNRYKVVENDSASDTFKLKVTAPELGDSEMWLSDFEFAYALRPKPKVPTKPGLCRDCTGDLSEPYTPTTEEVCDGFRGNPRKFEQAGEPIDAIGSNYGPKCYAAFHRWLAAHDAQIRAEAWDEGFTEGRDLAVSGQPMTRNNPYREQE